MSSKPSRPSRPGQDEPYDAPHSLRIQPATWAQLREEAERRGMTASYVLSLLAQAYVEGQLDVVTVAEGSPSTRSARIGHEVWAGLNERARANGQTATRVLASLATDYAAGRIDLAVRVVATRL